MDKAEAQRRVANAVEIISPQVAVLSKTIHQNPELLFKEYIAHDTISSFLEGEGFSVQRSAYGLETSFEAVYPAELHATGNDIQAVRTVTFCAEYDAIPEIGHACGHNLIASAAVAAFFALTTSLRSADATPKVRVRLLGCPAEEGGNGKAKLIAAGAFNAFDNDHPEIAIMVHPVSYCSFQTQEGLPLSTTGLAGFRCISSRSQRVNFAGKPAHAAGEPWAGVNALDAAVMAYTNISMLRQRLKREERVAVIIEKGGDALGIIPDHTQLLVGIRAPNKFDLDALTSSVRRCFDGAAAATGCDLSVHEAEPVSLDVRVNEPICKVYAEEMQGIDGVEEVVALTQHRRTVSTDMGNVSYQVPSFHGLLGIPTEDGVFCHNAKFADASGTKEAFQAAMRGARGLAMLGWRFIHEDKFAAQVGEDFVRGI
ncbi:hypothetical protein G7046_g2526 [Stylonectria norvegica]|nr:hypothetical protein G7046_g2526 [Stylonectria norvegica]